MNEGTRELSREEIRQLAGQVLAAIGVEKVEMDEGEVDAVQRAVEAWKRGKAQEMGDGI